MRKKSNRIDLEQSCLPEFWNRHYFDRRNFTLPGTFNVGRAGRAKFLKGGGGVALSNGWWKERRAGSGRSIGRFIRVKKFSPPWAAYIFYPNRRGRPLYDRSTPEYHGGDFWHIFFKGIGDVDNVLTVSSLDTQGSLTTIFSCVRNPFDGPRSPPGDSHWLVHNYPTS